MAIVATAAKEIASVFTLEMKGRATN